MTKRSEDYAPRLPLVYLSSPYTHGDQRKNLRAHYRMWRQLRATGLMIPFAPLCNESMERHIRLSTDEAFEIDFAILSRADALFAFDAEFGDYYESRSDGRRREVEFCYARSIPVFSDSIEIPGEPMSELIRWAKQFPPRVFLPVDQLTEQEEVNDGQETS